MKNKKTIKPSKLLGSAVSVVLDPSGAYNIHVIGPGGLGFPEKIIMHPKDWAEMMRQVEQHNKTLEVLLIEHFELRFEEI